MGKLFIDFLMDTLCMSIFQTYRKLGTCLLALISKFNFSCWSPLNRSQIFDHQLYHISPSRPPCKAGQDVRKRGEENISSDPIRSGILAQEQDSAQGSEGDSLLIYIASKVGSMVK